MRLKFIQEYEAELVGPRYLVGSTIYHDWMEDLRDEPMSISGSVDYLNSLHPLRRVYGLAFVKDHVEVVK